MAVTGMAELVTVYNVPLCETGVDWPASTGPVTFTSDDLLSAAEAPYKDPAVKLPHFTFGHFPYQNLADNASTMKSLPCVGKFVNLRVEEEGNLLVGDLTGVPKWLADILPTAYPSRSIDAWFDVTTSTGQSHKMIVPSVALLGDDLPGVQTLDDLQYLFSEEPTDWIQALTAERKVAAEQSRPGGDRIPQHVAASVDTSDVRSAFYEQVATDDRYYWWLHQMYLDPAVCIAEDDQMEYWLVPYSASDSGVEFSEPVQVFIQWVETESGNVAASAKVKLPDKYGRPSTMWASASSSRPAVRQAEINKKEEGSVPIDTSLLAAHLGLPEDASEEDINAALEAAESTESTETETEDEESTETDGEDEEVAVAAKSNVITVDKTVWEQTRAGAQAGLELRAERDRQANASFLDEALRHGQITRSSRDSYLTQMNGPDNSGNGPAKVALMNMIKDLPKGVAMPIDEVGHSEGSENTNDVQAGTGLFPKLEEQRRARAAAQEA